jgi:hypothetical protein
MRTAANHQIHVGIKKGVATRAGHQSNQQRSGASIIAPIFGGPRQEIENEIPRRRLFARAVPVAGRGRLTYGSCILP